MLCDFRSCQDLIMTCICAYCMSSRGLRHLYVNQRLHLQPEYGCHGCESLESTGCLYRWPSQKAPLEILREAMTRHRNWQEGIESM